jgi:hypothetical protein
MTIIPCKKATKQKQKAFWPQEKAIVRLLDDKPVADPGKARCRSGERWFNAFSLNIAESRR